MTAAAELSRGIDPLGIARTRAVHNLDLVLRKPEELSLREHQNNMLSALRDFFASGERAGYLSEPTGVGKSAVMVSAAEAMGLQTVILSPTVQILSQNLREARKFTPGLNITNYYTGEKDLSGKVINTTYQSIYSLLQDKKSGFDPEKVQLVLCDEAHVGLGLKRHEIYRYFPNALLVGLTATPDFTPLDGYIERGIVKEDEFWTGLFRNNIHEMTLEEAIERGILVGVDVHMLRTNTVVNDLEIQSNQEYRQSDLERYFATKSRNALSVGMIAGADKISKNVMVSSEQAKEITAIHNKIKGRRTVVFGVSISHIEELAKELKKAGISAAAVHGEMAPQERARILEAHTKGKIQVVLGVDLLRLGWDSPATEVSIHLKPTASGVKKIQELGRVLRPSPETGKENAIAIDLVDEVKKKQQQPVLIVNCFDPEYVVRGSMTGLEKEREREISARKPKLKLTFSGINVGAIIEQAQSQEMLRRRFKQASVEDISNLFDQIVNEALEKSPDIGLRSLFETVTDSLPERIPIEANLVALHAIASSDSNTAKLGAKALLLLNAKTILTVINSYEKLGLISKSEEEDVLAEAVWHFTEKLDKVKSYMPVAQQINSIIKDGIVLFIAKRDSLPVTFVKRSELPFILEQVQEVWERYGDFIPGEKLDETTADLSEKTGVSPRTLKRIFETRIKLSYLSAVKEKDAVEDKDLLDIATAAILKKTVDDILQGLTNRERQVLLLRFGMDQRGPKTLEETGREFNVTRETIRKIEAKALRRLRHPSRSRKLAGYIDFGGYPAGPSTPKESLKDIFGAERAKTLQGAGIEHAGQLFDKSPQDLLTDENKTEAVRLALNYRFSELKSMRWALTPTSVLDFQNSRARQEYWENPNSWELLISITNHILERYDFDEETLKLKGLSQNDLYYVDKLARETTPTDFFRMTDIERELRKKLFAAAYDELWESVKPPEPTEAKSS